MLEVCAAIGVEQLARLPELTAQRERNARYYDEHLVRVRTPVIGMARMRLFAKAAYQGTERLDAELITPIASLMRQFVRDLSEAAAKRGELRPDLDEAARLVHAFTVMFGDARVLPHLDHHLQLGQSLSRGPEALAKAISGRARGRPESPEPRSGPRATSLARRPHDGDPRTRGIMVCELALRENTLEDVFISLTGRRLA